MKEEPPVVEAVSPNRAKLPYVPLGRRETPPATPLTPEELVVRDPAILAFEQIIAAILNVEPEDRARVLRAVSTLLDIGLR